MTRRWKELLLFSFIILCYIICSAQDVSWATPLGDDLGDVALATENFRPFHAPGFPTILPVGYVFAHLPLLNTWQGLSLLSSLSFLGCSLLIFLIIRCYTDNEAAPFIGSITFSAAPLVFCEGVSSKGFEYGMSLFICLLLFYFVKRDRKVLASIVGALAMGTHPLAILFTMVIVLRYLKSPRYIAIVLSGFLLYSYIPSITRPPYGQSHPGGNPLEILHTEVIPLLFSMHASELIGRLRDVVPLLFGGLGLLVIPFIKIKRGKDVSTLLLVSVFIVFYVVTVAYSAHIEYLVFPLAFITILSCSLLPRLNLSALMVSILLIVPMVVMIANVQMYDIGRTLDPSPTNARRYMDDLKALPNGSIVIAQYTHVWTLTNYYECAENANGIILVGPGTMSKWSWCADDLRSRGLNIPKILESDDAWTEDFTYADNFPRILKEANSDRPIYWAILTQTKKLDFLLVPADADGGPSLPDVYLRY
jgi:hypothetical protein